MTMDIWCHFRLHFVAGKICTTRLCCLNARHDQSCSIWTELKICVHLLSTASAICMYRQEIYSNPLVGMLWYALSFALTSTIWRCGEIPYTGSNIEFSELLSMTITVQRFMKRRSVLDSSGLQWVTLQSLALWAPEILRRSPCLRCCSTTPGWNLIFRPTRQ